MKRYAALLALFAGLTLGAPFAWAHEDKDPVCGMMVEIEKAFGKEVYAGQTFYFCSKSCVDAFRANAEKFVGALRVFEMRGEFAVALTARPRVPKPGDLVRFYIQVGPPEKGGMIPDAAKTLKLSDGHVHLYRLQRDRAPVAEIRKLHETEEPGTYGFSKLIEDEGEYRIYFDGRYVGGTQIRAGLDCVTAGAMPQDDHHHGPPPTPAPMASPSPEHEGHGLSMAAQHETMKKIGEHWLALEATLDSPRAAQGHLAEIRRWTANLPKFQLHKFPEQKPEFDALSVEFEGLADSLEASLKKGDGEATRKLFRRIDATSCTKCHLKFRWASVVDLARYPDLSGQP